MADGSQAAGVAGGEREQFIPIRKSDILKALLGAAALGTDLARDQFKHFCRLLASLYHYEYFEQLEVLRDSYYYLNPEVTPPAKVDRAALEHSYAELTKSFAGVLKAGNFVDVPHEEIERAHRTQVLPVEVKAPREHYREVRFFRRGRHHEMVDVPRWWGFGSRQAEVEVYDDIVLLVATGPAPEPPPRRGRRWGRDHSLRPDSVLLKYFRNVASADLNALYPNVRVVLHWRDKLLIAVPAIVGAVPIMLNVASTITVLFVVLGFYLGVRGAVEDNDVKTALGALSALIAFGGFVMRQWVKYQRQSLRYQKLLSDNIYFRNVNNNAGIFDYMIGAAEEQECKEAFLAYYFVLTATTPPTPDELDATIEAWLHEHFGLAIDFEVDDALAKLDRLGLLSRDGDRLRVSFLPDALTHLDTIWDDYFKFNEPKAKAAAAHEALERRAHATPAPPAV